MISKIIRRIKNKGIKDTMGGVHDWIKYNTNLIYVPSYAQFGEDVILYELLNSFNLPCINYIDIGANHPIILNNTYLLSKKIKVGTGVLVEANPSLIYKLKKHRKKAVICTMGR